MGLILLYLLYLSIRFGDFQVHYKLTVCSQEILLAFSVGALGFLSPENKTKMITPLYLLVFFCCLGLIS